MFVLPLYDAQQSERRVWLEHEEERALQRRRSLQELEEELRCKEDVLQHRGLCSGEEPAADQEASLQPGKHRAGLRNPKYCRMKKNNNCTLCVYIPMLLSAIESACAYVHVCSSGSESGLAAPVGPSGRSG